MVYGGPHCIRRSKIHLSSANPRLFSVRDDCPLIILRNQGLRKVYLITDLMSSQAKGSATGSAVNSTTSSPVAEKALRKPHKQTEERLLNGRYGVHDDNENHSAQSTSKQLSADAPEFVPQSTFPAGNDEPLYGQFQRLVLNCPTHLSGNVLSNHCSATDMFRNAVFMLTTNPGGIEEHIKPVLDRLKTVIDTQVRDEIINILLEQGIMEPNFRYTGARLCKYLISELKSHPKFGDFKRHFLKRCGEEYDKREKLATNPETVERLCGLTMFFGELFSHLELEKDGVTEKVGILRQSLHQLIMTLLSHPDDVTVKCATQLLKMTGATIDDTADLGGNFDEVYQKINELKGMTSLNRTSQCLINSVLSLKDGNWGRGSISSSPQKPAGFNMIQQTQSLQNFIVDDPVFYDQMGQPITREQAGFYQEPEDYEGFNPDDPEGHYHWNGDQYEEEWVYPPLIDGSDAYLHWSSNPDDIPYDDVNEDHFLQTYPYGMDDEMMAAYEEFLEGQPQNQ
ncbi:hypothetical protein ACJMK2_041115 [Sinanodonta woodiana]|uniref:MIF4G domain-containing protein n=1 Tax=Sinanodonta woodiana TaxID=1069815 RepID=A0ABD3W6E5_SINWO